MKTRYLVLLVLGAMLVTGGSMAAGYLLSQEPVEEETAQKSTTSTSNNGGLNVSQSGTGQLNVLGDTNESAPAGEQLPGPEDFEVYEQYADAEGSLYADIKLGSGDEVANGDAVAVVYQGWLTNGELFDQSKTNEQGQIEAFSFQIGAGKVIQGWEQSIVGMKVGGVRRLIIPPAFGYGEAGQGAIPPNALLVFDVELVNIEKAQSSGQQPLGL